MCLHIPYWGSCLTPSRDTRCTALSCSIDWAIEVHQIHALPVIASSFPEPCVYNIKRTEQLFNTTEQTQGSSGTVSCWDDSSLWRRRKPRGGTEASVSQGEQRGCRQMGPNPSNLFLTASWASFATVLEAVCSDVIMVLH